MIKDNERPEYTPSEKRKALSALMLLCTLLCSSDKLFSNCLFRVNAKVSTKYASMTALKVQVSMYVVHRFLKICYDCCIGSVGVAVAMEVL